MTETPGEKSAAELFLDLTVFAPLGLAITVAEALPGLARKGRSGVPQVGVARAVGELAVRQGYRYLVGSVLGASGFPFKPSWPPLRRPAARPASGAGGAQPGTTHDRSAHERPAHERPAYERPAHERPAPNRPVGERAAGDGAGSGGAGGDGAGAGATGLYRTHRHAGSMGARGPSLAGNAAAAAAAAANLAIPSYDSLSAPQVVQRLAGLSRDEVVAIRAYESATRGRRTVLARADQLLA
jgi:hypothetical protein